MRPYRPSKSVLMLVGVLLLALSACSVFEEEPPEPLVQFMLLKEPRFSCSSPDCYWSTEDTLTAVVPGLRDRPSPEPDDVWVDLVLGDSAHVLTLRNLMLGDVPLEVGHRYTFETSLILTSTIGYPSLRVTDDSGLVYYATTSFPLSSEEPVLLVPEDWTFQLESEGYESIAAGCGLRATPQAVVVEHDESRVRMVQGETRRIGRYTVQVRIAVGVEYPMPEECTDTMIPELSVVIYRTPD